MYDLLNDNLPHRITDYFSYIDRITQEIKKSVI